MPAKSGQDGAHLDARYRQGHARVKTASRERTNLAAEKGVPF